MSESPPTVIASDFFDRTRPGWHLLFASMAALAVAFLLVDGHAPWALLPVGLAVAYVGLVVVPRGERARSLGPSAYLLLGYATVGVLTWIDPNTLVLLFMLYPETFLSLPRRHAIPATVVLTATYTLVLMARSGWSADALRLAGFGGVVTLAFSLALGLFLVGITRESEQRRTLIEELIAARRELDAAQRAAGAAAERERLSRDIHDTLAQGFTSVVMLAQAGEAALAGGKVDEVLARLEQIHATAREGLDEARSLVASTQPWALEGSSLEQALGRLVARFGSETGVRATFSGSGGAAPHSASADVVLLRAAQEALANVRRHAHARSVDVRLRCDGSGTTLEVCDDGRGFDAAAPSPGYGLAGMRARSLEVGGTVRVNSGARGTAVTVWVP